MQDEYRVRSGYIVELQTDEVIALDQTGNVLVEIDDTLVELYRDTVEVEHYTEADEKMVLAPDGHESLLSGFPAHFYDAIGDNDVLLLSEDRLDGRHRMIGQADGLVTVEEMWSDTAWTQEEIEEYLEAAEDTVEQVSVGDDDGPISSYTSGE